MNRQSREGTSLYKGSARLDAENQQEIIVFNLHGTYTVGEKFVNQIIGNNFWDDEMMSIQVSTFAKEA